MYASTGSDDPFVNVTTTLANFFAPSVPAAYSDGLNGSGLLTVTDTPSGHVAVDPNTSVPDAGPDSSGTPSPSTDAGSDTPASCPAGGPSTVGAPPHPDKPNTPTTAAHTRIRLMRAMLHLATTQPGRHDRASTPGNGRGDPNRLAIASIAAADNATSTCW